MYRQVGIVAGVALVLGGCTATHVVYVHDATLGISMSTAKEGTAKLSFGFERETFGLVPRFEDPENKTQDGRVKGDAMTVTAISRVYAEDISKVEFGHVVATGACAESLARQPETLKDLAQRVFVEQPKEMKEKLDQKRDEKKEDKGGGK